MELEQLENNFPGVNISLDTVIARNPSFISIRLDDELACVDESTGGYFGLNPTGAMIWEMLESPLTLQEIIEYFLLEFPENSADIPREIPPFVTSLASLNIFKIGSFVA